MCLDQNITETLSDEHTWYAIRLFSTKWRLVKDYLTEKQLEVFVPMHYVYFEDKEKHVRKELRPVVCNLMFVKKTVTDNFIKECVANSEYDIQVIRKAKDSNDFYEIPAKQMNEFRIMCNPDLELRKYVSESEAKLKTGTEVRVTHGPLKGLTGKLVRQSHKYYLLKEVPGMGVMIKVSRWCCVSL